MNFSTVVYISRATHVGREDDGFPLSFDELETLEER